MAVVGSTAAALLCLGGFGAVVSAPVPVTRCTGCAHPCSVSSSDARRPVALAAQTELAEVQQLIDEGQWDAAQAKLQTLTTTVATVNDVEQKQELVTQWQDLTVKVDAKDSNATLPPRRSAAGDARAGRRCTGLDHVDNHVVGDEQLDVVIVGTQLDVASSETSSSTSSSSEATTSSSSSSETTSSSPSAPKPPPPVQPPDDSSSSSSSSPKAPKPELDAGACAGGAQALGAGITTEAAGAGGTQVTRA